MAPFVVVLFDGKRFNSAPPGASRPPFVCWVSVGMVIVLIFVVAFAVPFPLINNFCKFPG